jgi:tetratricopeptide (TPR) repeat protein
MFNTGSCLAALNRNEESVLAYDALLAKFGHQTDSHFALYVVKALMNKAYRLNALSRNDDAIATYETVIARFGSSKDPETMPYIDSVKSFLSERQAVLDAREQTARA